MWSGRSMVRARVRERERERGKSVRAARHNDDWSLFSLSVRIETSLGILASLASVKFFIVVLTSIHSLKTEWQQISASLIGLPECLCLSQRCSNLDDLNFSDLRFLHFFQAFWGRFKRTKYNWYHRQPHVPTVFFSYPARSKHHFVYNYHFTPYFFSNLRLLVAFHWSLSNSKFPHFSLTLLRMADLNKVVVWMVLILLQAQTVPVPVSNNLGIVPSAPTNMAITVTHILCNFYFSRKAEYYYCYYSSEIFSHQDLLTISTGVWVKLSLHKSPGLISVF